MIPKKPAPDLTRRGHRLSEKTMLKQRTQRDGESNEIHPALAPPPQHTASFFLGIARARLKETLDPALIHFGNTAGQVDNQSLSAQDILATRDDHVAYQRNG